MLPFPCPYPPYHFSRRQIYTSVVSLQCRAIAEYIPLMLQRWTQTKQQSRYPRPWYRKPVKAKTQSEKEMGVLVLKGIQTQECLENVSICSLPNVCRFEKKCCYSLWPYVSTTWAEAIFRVKWITCIMSLVVDLTDQFVLFYFFIPIIQATLYLWHSVPKGSSPRYNW